MTKYAVGQKIYYTGDMANRPGWFEITEAKEIERSNLSMYTLKEINGDREFKAVYEMGISDIYEGHCGIRFVTEEAYKAYREKQLQTLFESINKRRESK